MDYYPDPNAALAAYGAPDMTFTPQEVAAYNQGPDPRLALQSYTGNNAAQLQQQDLKGMVGSMGDQQQAELQIGQVRADTANRQADAMTAQGVDQAMAAESAQMDLEESQAAQQKVLEEKRKVDEFIGSYEPRDRRDTGQRVMGALAIALGGIGDAVAVGGGAAPQRNLDRVVSIVNTGIERDLDAQREMISNKKTQSQGLDTELGHMQRMYGQTQQANEMARVMKLQQAQLELQTIAASGAAEEAKATAAGAAAKIGQQIEETKLRVDTARLQEERAMAAAAARGAGAGKGPDYDSMTPEQLKALHAANLLPDSVYRKSSLAKEDKDPIASADERKLRRLLAGVAPAAQELRAFAEGGGTPANPMVKMLPDIATPTDTLQRQASIAAVRDILLRDESGAAIGEAEAAKKIAGWGIESGDPAVRKEGLRRMLEEYDTRLRMAGGGDTGGNGLPPEVQARMDALGIKKKVR